MSIVAANVCARQQLCVAELARRALAGASIGELTDFAVQALALEAGVRHAVARHTLGAAVQSTAAVDETLRPFLETLTSVLALAQRLESVNALMDRLPDAIVRFDRELRCVYANASAERILGMSADQLHGLPVGELGLPEPQRGALELALQLTIRTSHEGRLELRIADRTYDTRLVPEVALTKEVAAIVSVWRPAD